MNISYHMFHSASVLRIFDCIGIDSQEISTPLKSDAFKLKNQDQDIWCSFIELEPQVFTLLFYSEIEEIRYLITFLFFPENQKQDEIKNNNGFKFFIICGDISGENFESNVILTEYKLTDKKQVCYLSCFDVCKCVQGFEIIKDRVGRLLPIQLNGIISEKRFEELVNDVIEVGNKITLEELNL